MRCKLTTTVFFGLLQTMRFQFIKSSFNLFASLMVRSVVLCVFLCKPQVTNAESVDDNRWRQFDLGGYSSTGINFHSNGDVDVALNEISLILRWDNDARLSFFSELELEEPLSWNKNDRFVHDKGYFDLERLYFDYNLSTHLNVRAGRFLTPVSRWNLLHAAPLVWTSTRPLATNRLFPISTNGLMMFGAIPLNNQGLEYNVFFETLRDQHRDGDETLFDNVKGFHLSRTGNTNIGVSFSTFTERIVNSPRFKMIGIDFITHYQQIEISGEAFQRFNQDNNNGGSGAYLQTVIPIKGQWFGIGRLETFQRPEEGSSDRWLIGTAWRVKPTQIFKMEIVGGDEERSQSPKGFLASFAILF